MRKSDRASLEFEQAERAGPSELPVVDALTLQPSSLSMRSRRQIPSFVIGTVVAAATLSATVVVVLPLNPAAPPAAPAAEEAQAAQQTTASLPLSLPAEPSPAVPPPQQQATEAAALPGDSQPSAATMPQAVPEAAPGPVEAAHPAQPTPSVPADSPSAQPEQAEVIQPLAAEDVAAYLEKGEEKIAAGDLAAARLFFERVVRSGDPRGALAMAKTFDPNVLSTLPIIGVQADPEAARSWYERAKSMQAAL